MTTPEDGGSLGDGRTGWTDRGRIVLRRFDTRIVLCPPARHRPPAPPVPHRQHPRQELPLASAHGTPQSDTCPCEPNRRGTACSNRGSAMTAALPARCPTPVAPLPPRAAQTLTLSTPKPLTFSMPIDTYGPIVARCCSQSASWPSRWPSRRDPGGESDLPARGAKGRHFGRHLCPSPWRTSGQKGGVALTTSTPLVRRAVALGEGGDTRGAASLRLSAADAGNPCRSASCAAFPGSSLPQRRGLRPLRERRCG